MFGYLVAAAGVLEDDQRQRYQELYCGLCRSLERCFGHPARLTLNYDMTFLVLLLGSLYEPEEETAQRRCPRHPLEAQTYVCSELSDYAANMNLALAYLKCLDDWQDEHRSIQRPADDGMAQQGSEEQQHHVHTQQKQIQLVVAVPPGHETRHSFLHVSDLPISGV